MEHPAVLEAGVVGVAEPTTGQRVKADVTLKPGQAPAPASAGARPRPLTAAPPASAGRSAGPPAVAPLGPREGRRAVA
jgi:acyl-CoA synthetase (AMP-forming)/AMP-acid ligase II